MFFCLSDCVTICSHLIDENYEFCFFIQKMRNTQRIIIRNGSGAPVPVTL